jgi:hypothetical protein
MMSDGRFASVWDAIEDTPAAAENLKFRSALMIALKERIELRAGPRGSRPPARRDPAARVRSDARQD